MCCFNQLPLFTEVLNRPFFKINPLINFGKNYETNLKSKFYLQYFSYYFYTMALELLNIVKKFSGEKDIL